MGYEQPATGRGPDERRVLRTKAFIRSKLRPPWFPTRSSKPKPRPGGLKLLGACCAGTTGSRAEICSTSGDLAVAKSVNRALLRRKSLTIVEKSLSQSLTSTLQYSQLVTSNNTHHCTVSCRPTKLQLIGPTRHLETSTTAQTSCFNHSEYTEHGIPCGVMLLWV
jgi:hypothetical protein